jgi:ABC-2 type transport system permease protein
MRKTLWLAKREYLTAVRTKGFLISLVLAPILMSGSVIAMALLKDRVDTTDQRLAVIDRSGVVAGELAEAAEERNAKAIFDEEDGRKIKPAYIIDVIEPDDTEPAAQRLELSDQIRSKKLHAILDIGSEVVHPGDDPDGSRIAYYAENASMDDFRRWLGWPVNSALRRARMVEMGVDQSAVNQALSWTNIQGLGLVSLDQATGEIQDARASHEGEAIGVPLIMVMLMFMMILMGAVPLLQAVMEEKSQRIAEVLLGSVKPFQFMMGKLLGGIGVSLTGSLVYVAGGIFAVKKMGLEQYIPYDILPWFFVYMLLAIIMIGASLAALGSACNDTKEAQSLTMPAMMPVMIPMFLLMPVVQNPVSTFATSLSLFPPFTPMLMLLRISTPVEIPAWQPWLGLAGIVLFTVLSVWAGGRIFRVGILMQGTPAKLGNIIRWAIRG